MYTIAFDETTDFEELRSRNRDKREEPAMLAGVIFNDTSRSVYKKDGRITEPERERIVLYYKKVCKAVHTSFPRDLHVTSNKSNADNVSKTKNEIRQTKDAVTYLIAKVCAASFLILSSASRKKQTFS